MQRKPIAVGLSFNVEFLVFSSNEYNPYCDGIHCSCLPGLADVEAVPEVDSQARGEEGQGKPLLLPHRLVWTLYQGNA